MSVKQLGMTPDLDIRCLDHCRTTWANGAEIEFLLYDAPLEGEAPSDRLHLLVTDCDGDKRGWIMNIDDAVTIIRGLSRLVDNALRVGVPINEG